MKLDITQHHLRTVWNAGRYQFWANRCLFNQTIYSKPLQITWLRRGWLNARRLRDLKLTPPAATKE